MGRDWKRNGYSYTAPRQSLTRQEFFKALKTGCAYGKRQLESARALVNALAVFTPVAFRLLYLRALTHHAPGLSARRLLTPTQLSVLRATARRRLPARPTARQALLAVAALGGHIKNNGEPGWLVLGRGYESSSMESTSGTSPRAQKI